MAAGGRCGPGRPDVHREGRAGAAAADPARCRARLAAGEDPSRWWSVLRGLDAAPIGTFHEFCPRLLRGMPSRSGSTPSSRSSMSRSPARSAMRPSAAPPLAAGGTRPRPDRAGDRLRPAPGPRGPRPAGVRARARRPREWSQLAARGHRGRTGGNLVRRPALARRPGSRPAPWSAVAGDCSRPSTTTHPKIRERRLALLDRPETPRPGRGLLPGPAARRAGASCCAVADLPERAPGRPRTSTRPSRMRSPRSARTSSSTSSRRWSGTRRACSPRPGRACGSPGWR